MKKPSALAGLAAQVAEEKEAAVQPPSDSAGRVTVRNTPKKGPRPPERQGEPLAREGRKALTCYFPPEVSRGLKGMAFEEDTTIQALVGEAIDMLMRSRGKHPFGAR